MKGGPGAFVFGEEERKEVMDVLSTGYLSRYGDETNTDFHKKCIQFEKEFAEKMGFDNCIILSSGTAALITGMATLGIGPGDEVIVPGYTFVASISAIIAARAIPVLAECDESLTIDPDDIERKITKRTKAIMPVHMLGNPCDMDSIMAIAEKYGLLVIEDCCQGCGASYKGKMVGSYGDIAAYSLNFFKTITSGDGGVLAVNDEDLYYKAYGYHDQGHMPLRQGKEVGYRMVLGINFKATELTGAVALAQLRKIDDIISILRRNKHKLKSILADSGMFKFKKINDKGEIATILTLMFDDKNRANAFSEKINSKTLIHSGWHVYNNMEQLLNKSVATDFGCPFDCPKYNKKAEYKAHMLPKTDDFLSRAVNISIGVVDPGIGASFGLNVNTPYEQIETYAEILINAAKEI